MNDIVERLREPREHLHVTAPILLEAAAEIERLRAENFTLAAGVCPHYYGDEYGNSRCAEIERLRGNLFKMTAHRDQLWERAEKAEDELAAIRRRERLAEHGNEL